MRRRITFRAIALLSGDITQLQTSLQQLVRDCRRLGLDRITPHGLRHTFATGSISTGDSVNGVQGMLGHSNVHTTLDIYSHVTRGMQRGISDHWDAMLNALDEDHTEEALRAP